MADQETELGAVDRIVSDEGAEPTKLAYALIKSITDDFSQEIGRGGFGVVYLGVLPSGKVAVKRLSISQDYSDQSFKDELSCLMRVKHDNIARFLGYCSDTQGELMEHEGVNVMAEVRRRLLVFEYAPNGSLQLYLTEKTIEWGRRYQMIKGICRGLQYLHKERISHLDLKPENVLLDVHMEPKITDLGLSRCFVEGQSRIFTGSTPGTWGYIAPELIDKGEISFKSDIFSLGIIIIKLLTGSNNYDFDNWHETIEVKSPKVECCTEIARTCVDANQYNRPSVDEILHKLNDLDSIEESRDDPGSSIQQVSGASAVKELPPSLSCVENKDGEKIKMEFNKMAPSPQEPADLKMPPLLLQPVIITPMRSPFEVIRPPPLAKQMEDPSEHSGTSDDEFDDSDNDPECFCVDDPRRIPQQQRRHKGGLNDKARPANAGSGRQDKKTDLVKGDRSPTSRNQPSQGKIGNVASVPTISAHTPIVGDGMLPEQFMTRYPIPNLMDLRPWSVPFPQQGVRGGEGGALSGREVLQVAAVTQNSMALQQQQHMVLMRQQQHQQHQQHMAFYLFLFLFLFMFTIIVIIVVILTFKKRG